MEQISYIFFGWLLGLLGPIIVDKIKTEYTKKQFFSALCAECHDLQYRVAIVSFMLGQKYGNLDREYLAWILPIIKSYKGNEPSKSIEKLIDSLLDGNKKEFNALIYHMRAEEGVGLSLKTFSASFLESNMWLISQLPIDVQAKIHEFKNHLNTLNQEIVKSNDYLTMTFDSSITDENHKRISSDIINKYVEIQGMCRRVAEKLDAVLLTNM